MKTPAGPAGRASPRCALSCALAAALGGTAAGGVQPGRIGPFEDSPDDRVYSPEAPRNPWRGELPKMQIMESWITEPVAPMDDLEAGVEAQFGPASIKVMYYPQRNDVQVPFPEPYPDRKVAWSSWNSTRGPERLKDFGHHCFNQPLGWIDSKDHSCDWYAQDAWCTYKGETGPGWKASWGTIRSYMDAEGVSALRACCACGGGHEGIAIGEPETPLEQRRLLAPEDKIFSHGQADPVEPTKFFPASAHVRPLMAPEDKIPPPLVAPQDRISNRFAKYIEEVYEGNIKPVPSGLSVRYYSSGGPHSTLSSPDFTGIDKALDYQQSDLLHPLGWPGKTKAAPPVFWARWSGTIKILMSGNYSLDFVVGFETTSEFKLDGKVLKTPGQCAAGKNKAACQANGCGWDPDGDEPCGVEVPAAPALLQAPRRAAKTAAGFLQAPAPAAVVPPSLASATEPVATGPPASADQPAATPGPAPAVIPITAAPAREVTHAPLVVELEEGGHCVEATVLVTNQGRTIRLMYSGPDTGGHLIAMPSAILFCDPVVKACLDPALASCAAARDQAPQPVV